MSLSNAPAAYRDCYQLYERAVTTPGGIRAYCGPERSIAHILQMRMNHARVLQRNQSKLAYPPGHHMHNSSEYDSYKIQILQDTNNDFWIYIQYHGNWDAVANAEPIPADEQIALPPEQDPAPTQPAQITHQPRTPTHAPEPSDLD